MRSGAALLAAACCASLCGCATSPAWAPEATITAPQPATQAATQAAPQAAPTQAEAAASAADAAAPQDAQTQALQGQISIKLLAWQGQPADGGSMSFFFQGSPQQGQLELLTAMGGDIAKLRWSPQGAWLQRQAWASQASPWAASSQRAPAPSKAPTVERFDDLNRLSQAMLGEAIPLQTVLYWLQGRADPQYPSEPLTDAPGFRQLDWVVTPASPGGHPLRAQRQESAQARGVLIRVYLDP